MPSEDIGRYKPVPSAIYYFDTSAVLALTFVLAKANGLPVPPVELSRAARVQDFAERANRSNAKLVTTVLAFEEIASTTRNKQRNDVADQYGHASWRDFKRNDAANAVIADTNAQKFMLNMMEWAAQQVASLNIAVDRTPVEAAASVSSAKHLRKAHRELLRLYPSIDSMDALHIAIGVELNVAGFVSLDHGWDTVATITVLR